MTLPLKEFLRALAIGSLILSETMRNLSDWFVGKVNADVDPERRSLDDEILGEYMDQEWWQAFLANEVGLLTISKIVKEKFLYRYNLVAPLENAFATAWQ